MTPRILPENVATNGVVSHCWELLGHYIEIQNTIFGGRRITIREIGDEFLKANWRAGSSEIHARTLLGLAKHCIENEIDYPFQSRVKPYFNDIGFLRFVDSYYFEPFHADF